MPLFTTNHFKHLFQFVSRSLFRTESEERHNLTTAVKGPVQSYSLFDTIWSRQNTPPQESKYTPPKI